MARRLPSLALLAWAVGACASGPPPKVAPPRVSAPATAPASLATARYFQSAIEEPFWVTHDEALDRGIVSGARVELGPLGEVLRSAWETDGEPIEGSLAVAARLGGGFMHYSRSRLYASREFTGPLSPIALPPATDLVIRGLRNGLGSVMVFTDHGVFSIAQGTGSVRAAPEPGLVDEAAEDDRRAVRIDVLGRARVTIDGGARWTEVSAVVGLGAHSIRAKPGELWIENALERFQVAASGRLDASGVEPVSESSPAYRTIFRLPRFSERDSADWGWGEAPPLLTAMAIGVALPGESALATSAGATARVDLATGKTLSITRASVATAIPCHPFAAEDGVLLLCAFERYEGYGAYVLRAAGTEPPALERQFTDNGPFLADDAGHLAYSGSCSAKPRYFDPGEVREADDAPPARAICVRRAAGDWVEHQFDGPETPIAWAPREGGGAIVLVASAQSKNVLPPARTDARSSDRGHLRVVRVPGALDGWSWPNAAQVAQDPMAGRVRSFAYPPVLRTLSTRRDGTSDVWLGSDAARVFAGATIDDGGLVTVHEPPAGLAAMVIGGDFGFAVAPDGHAFESTDHGRTWRSAGASPVPPSAVSGSCSALGCALMGFARVGWGDRAPPASIREPPPDAPAGVSPLPVLACTPTGAPQIAARDARGSEESSDGRAVLATGYGDSIEIRAEEEHAVEVTKKSGSKAMAEAQSEPREDVPPVPAPPRQHPKPRRGKGIDPWRKLRGHPPDPAPGGRAKPAKALRTHSLLWRVPFDPQGEVLRLNATDVANALSYRSAVVPLLGKGGEVELWISGDQREAIASRAGIVTIDPFDLQRFGHGTADLATGIGIDGRRALLLGDIGRGRVLEEHGKAPQAPSIFAGIEHELMASQVVSLGEEDGAAGVLVVDSASGSAGFARLNRTAASFGAMEGLAPWTSLVIGSDPRCKQGKSGVNALVIFDAATWIAFDARSLPGVTPGGQGMALVRWTKERVCLMAIDLNVNDARRAAQGQATLAGRFGAGTGSDAGAALLLGTLRQPLRCEVGPAVPEVP